MKKRNVTLIAVLLIGVFSLTGCDPSSKAEASNPVVVGAKDAQAAVVTDASGLYGTVWTRDLDTLTISKDGKVHFESLLSSNGQNGGPYLDDEGKTLIETQWDGFLEGGYIFVTEQTQLSIEYPAGLREDGSRKINVLGEYTTPHITHYRITYYGENGLILNDNITYIRKK